MDNKIKNPRTGKEWSRSLVEYDDYNNARFPDDYSFHEPSICTECGVYYADVHSETCVGCDAYKDHTA